MNTDDKTDDEQTAVYDESAYDESVYGESVYGDDEPAEATTEAREPGLLCDEPDSLCDTDGHELAE